MSFLNKTRLPYFLLGIGLFMIFSGGGSLFIAELKQDHEEVNKRQVNVKEIYENFSQNVEVFESERDNLYGGILNEIYYEELFDGDELIKESLDNYASIVNEIEKKVKSLDNLCKDMYYSEAAVNKMCSNYKVIYEQVNNCFVKDVASYNDNVKTYNIDSTKQINIFKTDRKYIDYNKDKSYDGK